MKLFGIGRRRREELEERQRERTDYEVASASAAMLRKTGWHNYLGIPPPDGVLCEFMRPEWEEPMLSLRRDLNPAMNMYGLYWRLFEEPDSPK